MDALQPLRALAVFGELTQGELSSVAALCVSTTYRDGELIVEEGVRAPGLYVVTRGAARVLKGVRGEHEEKLATLRDGEHFGEMSLVTGELTTATVRAEGATTCLQLPSEAFVQLLRERPAIGRKVLWHFVQTLSRRLSDTDRSLARAVDVRERRAAIAHLSAIAWVQFLMVTSYLWVWLRAKLRVPVSDEKLSRLHRGHARRFKKTAFRLKGANVKIGQLASMQAHLLPKEYVEELRAMRDSVTATDYPMIASLISHEFGVGPLDLFAEFDKVPIAAASMGQVHVARLHSGEKVVVKVQHPGLERSVDIDLALMRLLCRVLRVFVSRKLDLLQIMKEAEEPLRLELDLQHEGHATEILGRELEPLGVIVPKVYWRYTSRRVLTMAFLDGVQIDDLKTLREWKIDREKLLSVYLQAFLHQALEGGFFHADPHPGNTFCTRDGKLALLDFGMVKRLPVNVRQGLLKEMLGGFFSNATLYADGLIEKGAIGEADRGTVEAFATKAFNDPKTRALVFDHEVSSQGEVRGLLTSTAEMFGNLPTFRTPPDNVMFMRALGIVIDVAKEVLPEVPPSQIAMPVVMPIFMKFLAEHPEYAPKTP